MKRNWLLYLVIFSLALNFGTIATLVYLRYQDKAQRLSQEMPPPMALRALWGALNLDPQQRQAVRGLFPEHRARVMELRRQLSQKRREIFDLIKGEEPALAPMQAKVRELSELQGQLEEELVRFLLEFKKRLKPEQQAAFLNLMQARWDKALGGPCGPLEGRGRHGPRGHGPGIGPPPEMGPPPGMGPGPGGSGSPE